MQEKVKMAEQAHVRKHGEREQIREKGRVTPLLGRWIGVLMRESVWVGCAYLLGHVQMLFGVYPIGLALLCASGTHTVAILCGAVLAAISVGVTPAVYVCTLVLAALVRILSVLFWEGEQERHRLSDKLKRRLAKKEEDQGETVQVGDATERDAPARTPFGAFMGRLFSEQIRLRMATAAVCALVIGLYRVFAGGFQYYDFFATLFLCIVTPAATMAYAVGFSADGQAPLMQKISRTVLLFSAVWAGNEIYEVPLSVSATLAILFTLYVSEREGYLWGCITGAVCGAGYLPLYAPGFLLAAPVYLFFSEQKRAGLGILLSVTACQVWAVYVGGASVLLPLLPASLAGATLFSILQRFLVRDIPREEDETDEDRLRRRMEGIRYQDANDRFRGISDAFSSLSEMFYNLSDRFRRPGTLDLRRICDASFDRFCPDCANRSLCWGLEYAATLDTVNRLIDALHTKGRVTRAQIPDALTGRCKSVSAILEEINRECAKLTGELLNNNRTEIFAMDYESAANIINDALEEDDGEYCFDAELEQRITDYLSDAGIRAGGVTVYGKRRRQILVRGVAVEGARITLETLRSDLGEMCGMELSHPRFEVNGMGSTMSLQARRRIAVSGAHRNLSSDGGVSGDTVNLFSNKKDYFYALISDGMGAGCEAALTSGICSVFMERMLRAGNRAVTSLRMLNNMISSRGADSTHECTSTVDLLELDLMTAQACFIKSGAAPSFVVRGQAVHRLQAGSVPIGIIGTLDAERHVFDLSVGDTVVMISDGILNNDPECEWLITYLSNAAGRSPEELVRQICAHAHKSETRDDCSAVALRIIEATDE